MPAPLQPIRRFKCTYKDCDMSFDTERLMKGHKKHSDEHEYCHKCDKDFDSFEDYAMHKITRPVEHGLACRVCGDEFKSQSGLRRHIELNHKVEQKLICIGCHKHFYSASLFLEHLEFGYCEVITASEFQGHVVHKQLITEFLKSDRALDRFRQKTSKFEAALDYEDEGGVRLNDPLGDGEDMAEIEYKAIEPETTSEMLPGLTFLDPYPPLPSKSATTNNDDRDLASSMGDLSLQDEDGTQSSAFTRARPGAQESTASSSSSSSSSSTTRELKTWGSRKGKSTSAILFPNAKPNPPPSEFSIAAHDEAMKQEHGINIMRTRFWDPLSTDWNPEKFYDAIVGKYHCPFICEQTFDCTSDLNQHILGEHRMPRTKCPRCLKCFGSVTALMAHCESRGARCQISMADDFNIFLNRLSGGFLSVKETIRPDHLNTRNVLVRNSETGRMEMYKPPVARYLEYSVTTPPDWKGLTPASSYVQIGGIPKSEQW